MYANIEYTIAKIKKLVPKTVYVKIKYIAKKVIATKIGLFNNFCKTIESNIVANGNIKNNSMVIVGLL